MKRTWPCVHLAVVKEMCCPLIWSSRCKFWNFAALECVISVWDRPSQYVPFGWRYSLCLLYFHVTAFNSAPLHIENGGLMGYDFNSLSDSTSLRSTPSFIWPFVSRCSQLLLSDTYWKQPLPGWIKSVANQQSTSALVPTFLSKVPRVLIIPAKHRD